MQQKQYYFACRAALFSALILAFSPPSGLRAASAADPLLQGGPVDPCQAGADYVPGRDSSDQAVPPADVGQGPVPVPDQVAVPLGGRQGRGPSRPGQPGDRGYVSLDGRKLDPLLNPPPCK